MKDLKNYISHFKDDYSFSTVFAKFPSVVQREEESVGDYSVRVESLAHKNLTAMSINLRYCQTVIKLIC